MRPVLTSPLILALFASFVTMMALADPFQVAWHFPITYYDFKGPTLARDFTQGVIPSIRDGADASIGLLTGFDAATGDILWSRPDSTSPGFGSYSSRSYLTSSPGLDVAYYVINKTVLVAFNVSTGKIVNTRLINATAEPTYIEAFGKIAITTENRARLLDLSTLDDDVVFEGFTNLTTYSAGPAASILKGTGIIFTQNSAIFAYVPPSQQPLWTYSNTLLGGNSVVDPHGQYIVNSQITDSGFGGSMFGLDAQTGNVLWNVSAPLGYFSSSFSVVTPTILVSTGGNDDGYQLGFGFISGHELSTGDLLYNHSYTNYSFMTCSAGRSEIMKGSKGSMVCITALRAPDGDTPVLQLCEIPIGTGELDTSKCMKLPATSCGASLYEYISIVISDDSTQVFLSVTNGASEMKALVIGLRRD